MKDSAAFIYYNRNSKTAAGCCMEGKTMKKWKKVLLAAVLLLAVGGYAAFVKISYYPMGGEVTIVDKFQSGDNYYIVIEAGKEFTLRCPESEYDKVNAGDMVYCERDQSIVTHKGEVHRIKKDN